MACAFAALYPNMALKFRHRIEGNIRNVHHNSCSHPGSQAKRWMGGDEFATMGYFARRPVDNAEENSRGIMPPSLESGVTLGMAADTGRNVFSERTHYA